MYIHFIHIGVWFICLIPIYMYLYMIHTFTSYIQVCDSFVKYIYIYLYMYKVQVIRSSTKQKFSKVKSVPNWRYKMTVELTFEKFYHPSIQTMRLRRTPPRSAPAEMRTNSPRMSRLTGCVPAPTVFGVCIYI